MSSGCAFTVQHKKYYISHKKRGNELSALEDLRSILRINIPVFPFEFSVEKASNKMIDVRSKKDFKATSTFISCFITSAKV